MAAEHPINATLRGSAPNFTSVLIVPEHVPVRPVELDETVDAALVNVAPPPARVGATATPRSTVLPRRRKAGPEEEKDAEGERPRFDRLRTLGEGGMGAVELVRDNDIRRTVAVKRLRGDVQSAEAFLRFADEVRIVGQLEHPGIVPVYDVGRDETGQVYLVMKHLNGETMEDAIEKLRAKDPACVARYSIEYRVHVFIAILDAIRYAHARGVIHRDLKPANVMIGPYGEVTVVDWGIAKPIRREKGAPERAPPLDRTLVDSHDRRLQETQLGSLAGTPLYMSPEQAAGRNDELDERSDVYSLCLLLYEWLSLMHPLAEKKTVTEVLAALINGLDVGKLGTNALFAEVPAEWVRMLMRGLQKEIDKRFQSVDELEREIRDVLDGRLRIQCHMTLAKRVTYEMLHWIDRHPKTYTFLFFGTTFGGVLGGLIYAVFRLAR